MRWNTHQCDNVSMLCGSQGARRMGQDGHFVRDFDCGCKRAGFGVPRVKTRTCDVALSPASFVANAVAI